MSGLPFIGIVDLWERAPYAMNDPRAGAPRGGPDQYDGYLRHLRDYCDDNGCCFPPDLNARLCMAIEDYCQQRAHSVHRANSTFAGYRSAVRKMWIGTGRDCDYIGRDTRATVETRAWSRYIANEHTDAPMQRVPTFTHRTLNKFVHITLRRPAVTLDALRCAALAQTMFAAFLRPSEPCLISRDYVDIDEHGIRIGFYTPRELRRLLGGAGAYATFKNDPVVRGTRRMPRFPNVSTRHPHHVVLGAYVRRTADVAQHAAGHPLFLRDDGTPLRQRDVAIVLKPFLDYVLAREGKRVTPRTMRASAVTAYTSAGADPNQIAALGRWKHADVPAGTYTEQGDVTGAFSFPTLGRKLRERARLGSSGSDAIADDDDDDQGDDTSDEEYLPHDDGDSDASNRYARRHRSRRTRRSTRT